MGIGERFQSGKCRFIEVIGDRNRCVGHWRAVSPWAGASMRSSAKARMVLQRGVAINCRFHASRTCAGRATAWAIIAASSRVRPWRRTSGSGARICLSFPEATETRSHGSPDFRVRGKTFASFVVNHHGDGRVALWLHAPPGAQQHYTEAEPEHFFVPPYVGPRGWLGVHLDKGSTGRASRSTCATLTSWSRRRAARRPISAAIAIEPPTRTIDPTVFDPLTSKRAKAVLEAAAPHSVCRCRRPRRAAAFGAPVWRAGKKTFCEAHRYRGADS